MKKLLVVLALLVLALAIVGCTKEVPADEPAASPDTPAPAPTEPVASDVPADEPVESGDELAEGEDTEPAVIEGEGDVTEAVEEKGVEYSLPVDVTTETDYFDEVGCKDIDGKLTISVKVTNSGTENWYPYGMDNPKGNLRFTNRGVTDTTPGCGSAELAPGDTTVCSTIDQGTISGENRISIQSTEGTEVRVVMCP